MITNNVKQSGWSPKKDDTVILFTGEGAKLDAKYDGECSFKVTTTGWWFGKESCREAAQFFTLLADILENK